MQLALVASGEAVLAEDARPPLLTRLTRLCCYFTIQSNLLVLVSTLPLVRDPRHDGRWWRVLRLAAVVGITITALVHVIALRPLLTLEGLNAVADTLLHVLVPGMAVVGWLVAGPHHRVDAASALTVLIWPVTWLAFILAVGSASGWYPYPFIDPSTNGWSGVALAAVAIAVAFVVVLAAARALDRRLPRSR